MTSSENIGALAHAALRRGGRVTLVASLDASTYLDVGGTLVWVGETGAPLHPRTLTVTSLSNAMDATLADIKPWRPPLAILNACPGKLQRAMKKIIDGLGDAQGFLRCLCGQEILEPFDVATQQIVAFARCCGQDDVDGAVEIGRTLLGVGPGLTPSGDDFVGGALFAKRALMVGGRAPSGWSRACRRLAASSRTRTTKISSALFADLAAGRSFRALHDLAFALDRSDDDAGASSARQLVCIGHSSGWDMLAGFAVGVGVAAKLSGRMM